MVEFRQATLNDAEALLHLTLRAYQPIRELGINFAAANADMELVKKNIRNNMCFLMEEEGKLLSTLSLRMPWGDHPGPFGVPHIWWFATDPDYAGQGIGNKLITWCEEKMVRDTLKSPAVSLGTADKHPWLVDIYKRRGYQEMSRKDLGKGHITVFMKKELTTDIG
ncbi:GNAT family N-acetyltransferase [Gracilibacillus sp. S3-1-1]|uniref:GNAT family N-acetyltransferase n=1 Tax=Gracilibacillus pellucidus TaxID=3095368 RepID=A0ACC6M8S4_9BACI|nr:GNAT family N-acetyltransferase [Gracilibacillus sp. S3-1-1]MDX8047261.1 GNAT family N-acetyltransferase [Gracilibacillus sp. S3-1-1]